MIRSTAVVGVAVEATLVLLLAVFWLDVPLAPIGTVPHHVDWS